MDVKLKNVSICIEKIYADGELIKVDIQGYDVNFEIQGFESSCHITTNKTLSVEEIKKEIKNKLGELFINE